ncbi:MAG: hypothetical protein ABW321_24090 [Polyangiales bacterium]
MKTSPRRARLFRLLLLFGVMSTASTVWLYQRASAEVSERALQAGRQLSKLEELARGMSTLRINGARMTLSASTSEQDVAAVLNRFGALCSRASGGIDRELAEHVARGARLPAGVDPQTFGILRSQRGELEGVSACFAREGEGGVRDFSERLLRAADSGDLGELGQLRYVFARRRAGSASTQVITVWSDGALPIAEMFPTHGDVPGRDLFDGARPPDGRRVIAAELEGSDHHIAIYETSAKPEAALAGFDTPLRSQGFAHGDLSKVDSISPIPTRVYLRPDATVLVLAEEHATSTTISAFRLAHGGYVSTTP